MPDDPSRPVIEGPRRGLVAGVLVVIVIVSALASLVRLGAGGPQTWHEAVALASAHETWLRGHEGIEGAWVVPYIQDRPRFAKPPMIVWLDLAAWTGLDPATATTPQLVLRSRLVGVALGAVTLLGVFLVGGQLMGARLGLLAAAMAGTLPYLQSFTRMATYDVGMLAGTTVAIGCALWAIAPAAPDRPSRARRAAGWAGCAMALAFAWLCKGPLSAVIVVLGVLPVLVVHRRGRLASALLLAVSVGAAALIVLRWYLQLRAAIGPLGDRLLNEYTGPAWDRRPPWYYLYHVNWTLPWTLWLLAGLAHPFVQRDEATRRRLAAWGWLIVVVLFFSIIPQKVKRYVLPAAPALAMVAAMVWRDHLADTLRGRRVSPLLGHLHWGGCALVSLVVCTAPLIAGRLDLDASLAARLAPWPTLAAGLALAALVAIGWHVHARRRLAAAAACAFLWAALACGGYWWLAADDDPAFGKTLDRAHAVEDAAAGGTLICVTPRVFDRERCRFELGIDRLIGLGDIDELQAPDDGAPLLVITTTAAEAKKLRRLGGVLVIDEREFESHPHMLWRLAGP